MPTIRVEEDVFEGLKSLAEPFTDTPNTVIRRLLLERGAMLKPPGSPPAALAKGASSTRREGLTPQGIYEIFLLHVLATEFKGEAEKADVTRAVIAFMKERGFIGPLDEERVKTGETKAENTVAWGRNALKERGLVSRTSRRGIWELTPQGLAEARNVVLPRNN